MKRPSVLEIAAAAVLVVAVVATLAPVAARVQRSAPDATCQGNMRMWAKALDLYLQDNGGRYPTNRLMVGSIAPSVRLSAPLTNPDGSPVLFMYGVNWVEALYGYVKTVAETGGRSEAYQIYRSCPNASQTTFPANSTTPSMSYALNANLVESWTSLIRNPRNLMMLREMDRLVDSVLRPMYNTTGTDTVAPRSPFLNANDAMIHQTNYAMHANGSHIVFADGHVAYFDHAFFEATDSQYSDRAHHFDYSTGQWYNWVFTQPANDTEQMLDRSIAISP